MAKEYIAIDKNTFPTPFTINPSDYAQGWNACLKSVMKHKTADVEPVRHGEWIYDGSYCEVDECHCSLCNQFMTTTIGMQMPYCPNCGAKMDGGKVNE
jgi:hypothetical protein